GLERCCEVARRATSALGHEQLWEGDESRGRLEDHLDLAQSVHLERGAGGRDVDDHVCDAEVRRDLGGTGDRNDGDVAAAGLEARSGDRRNYGCDAGARRYVVESGETRVVTGGDDDAAAADAEVEQLFDRATTLDHEVVPGDS